MSLNHIKQTVAESLHTNANNFEIQIYDECCNDYFTLDDELLEDLHGRLPRINTGTLYGRVLLNNTTGCCRSDRCYPDIELEDIVLNSSTEWSTIDWEHNTPAEISLTCPNEDVPECLEALLIPGSDDELNDTYSSHDFGRYSTCISQPQNDENQTNLLTAEDEITRNICHSNTSFQSDDNDLHIVDSADHEAQVVVQNVINMVVNQSIGVEAKPLYSDWYGQHSDDITTYLPGQVAQETSSEKRLSSLQFVHDVHPYQKTQHHTNSSDQYTEKNLPPYIMRIQGVKTNADKGKSILPRIKLPPQYMSSIRPKTYSLSLMVAAVVETKVNDKRLFYVCENIQFLPVDARNNTEAVNPIQFNLNSLVMEPNGIFELSLRLVNNSSQSTTEQPKNRIFYELDENTAKNLHLAPYDPRFFRLVCTLVKDQTVAWDTLCLSDYIRPKPQVTS